MAVPMIRGNMTSAKPDKRGQVTKDATALILLRKIAGLDCRTVLESSRNPARDAEGGSGCEAADDASLKRAAQDGHAGKTALDTAEDNERD